MIGTSSEAIRGKTKRTSDGEIIEWPLMRDSLTFTPAEPRMLMGNALQAAKSLREELPNSKSLSVVDSIIEFKASLDRADTLKDIECLLRDASGFSRADATALVSRIKSLVHGEREAETKASENEIKALINARLQKLTGNKQ